MLAKRYRAWLAVLSACLCVPAWAQAPKAPRPAPEMAQLAFFVGTVACDGESRATPLMGPHPIKRTITGRMDLDGFWLFMRFDDDATVENPTPIRGNWQLIHDRKAANFVAIWTDNLGRWFPQTSPGWAGDTIAFTGEFLLNDRKAAVRDIFTRTGENEMKMTVQLETDGHWAPLLDLMCRK